MLGRMIHISASSARACRSGLAVVTTQSQPSTAETGVTVGIGSGASSIPLNVERWARYRVESICAMVDFPGRPLGTYCDALVKSNSPALTCLLAVACL